MIDALRDIEAGRTIDEVWQTALAALDRHQVGFAIYLTVASDYSNPVVLSNFAALYDGYDPAKDPFLHYCCDNYDVTCTGGEYLADYPYLPPEAQALIKKGTALGFRSGLGIPVRLAGSPRFGGFNFGTRLPRAEFEAQILPRAEALRVFALILHRRLEELGYPETTTDMALDVPPNPALVTLSPREREIIWLTAKGLSRKEIARCCNLSPHTVADYTKGAYRKLGVSNRVEATRLVVGV